MIKKIQLFIFLLLVATNISANNKEFKITNNNDKTISINIMNEKEENTIYLQAIYSDEVLFEKELKKEKSIVVKIPAEPYLIILKNKNKYELEMGIEPRNGFTKHIDVKIENILYKERLENEDYKNSLIFFYTFAFIFILLAVFFNMRNTNKLLKQLEKNKK